MAEYNAGCVVREWRWRWRRGTFERYVCTHSINTWRGGILMPIHVGWNIIFAICAVLLLDC